MSTVPNPYARSRRGGPSGRARRLILLTFVCSVAISVADWLVG